MRGGRHERGGAVALAAARLLVVCCGAFLVWRLVRVATAPLEVLVQFVPDDAFYYLAIARELARTGRSSFDGGLTTTTGYHVLWAWMCEALVWVGARSGMGLLRGMVWLSGGLALGGAAAAASVAWRRRSVAGLLAVAVVGTSFSYVNNLVSGMEWAAVVAVSVATLGAMVRAGAARGRARAAWMVGLFGLGVVGSLGRSDHGATEACYLAAAVWLAWRWGRREYVQPAIAAVGGAVVGLVLVLWRDWRISGQLTQGSARMKGLWSAAGGRSPLPFLLTEARTFLFVPGMGRGLVLRGAGRGGLAAGLLAMVVLALVAVGWWWPRARAAGGEARDAGGLRMFLGVSAGLVVAVYTGLYAMNSLAMQPWYTANVTVAAGVLVWLGLERLGLERLEAGRMVVAAVAAVCGINAVLYLVLPPVYARQTEFVEVGERLRGAVAAGERVGFSDTGIVSFAAGGGVINTDGLVNDALVRYAPGRLPCYVLASGIELFNGFGPIADRVFPMVPVERYAVAEPMVLRDGTVVAMWRVDRARLRTVGGCGAGQ